MWSSILDLKGVFFVFHPRWATTLPSGREQSGFFAANFTLQEIRTLYARQAIPFRNQASSHSFRRAPLSLLPHVHSERKDHS